VEFDKRQDIKEREADRELKRAAMHHLKRKLG
jgi:tmRNA-binding protein